MLLVVSIACGSAEAKPLCGRGYTFWTSGNEEVKASPPWTPETVVDHCTLADNTRMHAWINTFCFTYFKIVFS